jgi:peptide methionine sulfoxide reductase MsrA
MKYLLMTFFFIPLVSQNTINSQISTAMKAGSAKALTSYCNNTVEIRMDGESANYSRIQAEVILKNFFEKHEPVSFNYTHQGSSPEGLQYTIGTYTHASGSFRVVMFIKKTGNEYKIDTINFSKE